MSKKSQLPMLRSLKAIARRKASIPYHRIETPPEVKEAYKARQKARDDMRYSTATRALMKLSTADRTILALTSVLAQEFPTLRRDETQRREAVNKFRKHLSQLTKTVKLPAEEGPYEYGREQVQKAQKLFHELETLELQIIAGEEVDLAPYARQLQS